LEITMANHLALKTAHNVEAGTDDKLAFLGKDSRLVSYGGGNAGLPLELLEPDGPLIVPTNLFFMRCNGPVPLLDHETWRLTINGRVERPLSLRLADLAAMPQRRLTAFVECAGNGRTRFDPLPPGIPWRNDAVGCAVWEGVSLATVLELTGVRDGAVDVVSQGGDFPAMRRGLPLSVARDTETLLVLRMNNEPLPAAHGGPVRLLVPGWAGIASTKWLVGLEVLDNAFAGTWNSESYVEWGDDGTALRPVREMGVKSVLSAPTDGAILRAGLTMISGYAWSGYGAIQRVETSSDGGRSWQVARLERSGRRGWVRFESPWEATPGMHHLLARATDERGLQQPRQAAWNAKGYGQNGIHYITVSVAARQRCLPYVVDTHVHADLTNSLRWSIDKRRAAARPAECLHM
jgi:sulfane dehydrogenase subunit SoxC